MATMTTRLIPPGDGLHNTIKVNGRTYTGVVGGTLDVSDHDALVMVSNGWLSVAAAATTGTTTQRPAAPSNGQHYVDTTLGALILFDTKGNRWVHSITGASA